MARKKAPKKKAKAPAAEGRSKKEIKEIKSFLKEHGWQATISEYKISPMELSAIKAGKVYKPKAKKKAAAKKKAPKKKAAAKKKAPKKKAAAKKRATKKKATNDAPYGLKADGTPRARPGPKKSKASTKKKATKKATPRKASPSVGDDDDGKVLDYLLSYRNRRLRQSTKDVTLDEAIIDLTSRIRGAA